MEAQLFINGDRQPAAGNEVITVCDPSRPTETVGTIARGGAPDVDLAVAAAESAFLTWSRTPLEERIAALALAADHLAGEIEALSLLLTREMGKVLRESLADVGTAEFMLRYLPQMSAAALAETSISDDFGSVTVEQRPIGVVGVIIPWNWPPSLLFVRLATALSAGNTIVCVPSPFASLAVTRCVEVAGRSLPPGVVNVVTGHGPEAGAALAAHPRVRKISFTGSARTGREVLRAAATNIKIAALELGGNDPALLLDDVEVDDELVSGLLEATMTTTGQICIAAKRIYVATSRFSEVVEAFSAAADQLVVGPGVDPQVTTGPLVNHAQVVRFDRFISEARERGATVRQVGTFASGVSPDGYFRLPCIVTGADESFAVVNDEQFGPATPFLPFDNIDEAVVRANATEFGLGASVWSADPDRARSVGRRLEAGMVFINRHNVPAVHPRGIFGGVKQSGLGRELGRWGLEGYTETCEVIDPLP